MEHIGTVAATLSDSSAKSGDDYQNDSGILICGKCHTPKQIDAPVSRDLETAGFLRVPNICKCEQERIDHERRDIRERQRRHRLKALERQGFLDSLYLGFRFDIDDRARPKISAACRAYVDKWEVMRAENIGILFHGSVGTGKTFLACCIANALVEKLVPVYVNNLSNMIDKLQCFGEEKQEFFEKLQKYDLLVIDDFGAERNTEYALEQIFGIVDARLRTNKPVIITTNLTEKQLCNPTSNQQKRIYDRVNFMCPIKLDVSGISRRLNESERKKQLARDMLKSERKGNDGAIQEG